MCPCELGACTLNKERNFNLEGDNFGLRCPILHSYKCILSRYIIVTIKYLQQNQLCCIKYIPDNINLPYISLMKIMSCFPPFFFFYLCEKFWNAYYVRRWFWKYIIIYWIRYTFLSIELQKHINIWLLVTIPKILHSTLSINEINVTSSRWKWNCEKTCPQVPVTHCSSRGRSRVVIRRVAYVIDTIAIAFTSRRHAQWAAIQL